jgi:hypothetical protein
MRFGPAALSAWMSLWAASAVPLPTQEEPDHDFLPPKPEWTVREEWLRRPRDAHDAPKAEGGRVTLRRDGLITIPREDRKPGDPEAWRERRYFDGQHTAKIQLYDPEKHLRMEADDSGKEQFTHLLYPNGNTAAYIHVKNGRWQDGFSVSADGKTTRRVIEGTGDLVEAGYRTGDWIHRWMRQGSGYLEKEYRDGSCISISCGAKDAFLSVRPDAEYLSLSQECESWIREKGKPPIVQIQDTYINLEDGSVHRQEVPPKTDLRRLPYLFGGDEEAHRAHQKEIREIEAEWAIAYPKRRAAFLTRYSEEMKAAGVTWSELGIEFIRNESPWFPAGTTTFPRVGGRKVVPFRCRVDLATGRVAVDRPRDLEKDEAASWDELSAKISRGGRTYQILIEDNKAKTMKELPPRYPDCVRVSIAEFDDRTRERIRTLPVQEFQGEHEDHGPRAFILKDGALRFWMEFWTND